MFAAAGLEEGDGKPFVGRLRGICINPSAAEGEVALASDPLGSQGRNRLSSLSLAMKHLDTHFCSVNGIFSEV